MAIEQTNVISTDIYRNTEFIESIKKKYIDIPEDTLFLGVFGYLSSVFSNLLENTTIMASEYSNEAIPTKAKFERNIIAHALSLGINEINASPAELDVVIGLPEETLLANMRDNKFTLDKEYIFSIGEREQYPYHLDYDIIISRDKLPNGKYVYNAKYDIDGKNKLALFTNPYLPAIGIINVSGDSLVSLKTTLRQTTHTQIFKKIIVNNPLENKVLNFEFEGQLAYFYVDVVENGITHYLEPVYDGLYDYTSGKEFINYLYLDEKNIRLRFNRDSYQPRQNAEVTIHIYTTLGAECNFSLGNYEILRPLTSERFPYDGLYVLMQAASDSQFGTDKLSVETLKETIPREALSRGSISTYTDLNNAFNSIQRDDCKLHFLERVHNQIERLYFSYLLIKDEGNVVPTNTIDAEMDRAIFSSTSKDSFTMKPGAMFYLDPDTEIISGVNHATTAEIERMDKDSFLYMNPYLTVINKSPFYVSYYMVLMNYTRNLYFTFINENSLLQFVSLNFYVHRDYFTDPDTYKIQIRAVQNINTDFQLITYNDAGSILECKFQIYAVLYQTDSQGQEYPYKYMKGELQEYEEENTSYLMQFSFKTNDIISSNGTYITITDGMYNTKTGVPSVTLVPPNMIIKFFFVAKLDKDYGRMYGENLQQSLDDIIPNLNGYTLTNIYDAGKEGLDIFYDYSDLQSSYINLSKMSDGAFKYYIHKMPVVRYTYLNTEERIRYIFKEVDKRRRYIQNVLLLLEDSFGIDYKFFNTYGKSKMYNIDNETNIDRINLSLKFEIKFQIESDKVIISQITNSIKEYIEDLNNITDLHMPNLITYITNLYREHLTYIKFIGLNDYESLHQSIYKNPILTDDYFLETQTVPEFINVNTLNNGLPDISFKIIS